LGARGGAVARVIQTGDWPMKIVRLLSAILFLGGVAFAVYYFNFFDTSVSTTTGDILIRRSGGELVHDLDLIQEQRKGLTVSSLVAIAGLVLVAASDRIRRE
jgi:hypothetical protein